MRFSNLGFVLLTSLSTLAAGCFGGDDDAAPGTDGGSVDVDAAQGGKVDDAASPERDASTSHTNGDAGSAQDAGGEPPDGPPSDGLGLASFPSYSFADQAAFLAGIAGSHDVVIFRAPQGNESWIGRATLTLMTKGSSFTAKLETQGGVSVAEIDGESAISSQVNPGIGQVFGFTNNEISGYLNVSVTMDGLITGSAGGLGEVGFRNQITAFGTQIPSLFAQLAGTYRGVSQALTRDQPEVVLTLATDGSASLMGKYNLSCDDGTVKNSWDGNDDYVIPSMMGGYELRLDSQKGGGSTVGGGIGVTASDWTSDATITLATSNGSGSIGEITSNLLVQDGELPTQDQFVIGMLEGTSVDVTPSGSTDTAPWDSDNESFTIDADGNLLYAGLTFAYQLATNVEGTSDQKRFRFQAIYMSLSIVWVELVFATDETFVSGTFGGVGNGALAPK